ncbi:universal stress protein [Sphingobacterium sp. lm-10]|uniref:universal stress protein n=1 Tax=Sphingobacterium sp. lm-10 TaxID=2944904 RepID=UPI0020219121|nr:universal stress protein [Sphingobacterium sp. lm-10]MCL7987704.1 universal stress protein [Sphingobacterium sp. lm-10]
MRNTILVPTDFSKNSISAVRYACQLAKHKGYDVHLLHFYTSNTANFASESNNEALLEDSSLLKADVLMKELKDELMISFPELTITSVCVRGLIDEKLPVEAGDSRYALIVMGATGSSAKKSIYYGSTTVAITAKSPIPVVAVPEGQSTFALQHISLLTKFKPEELETLRSFIETMGKPEQLSLTHVYREESDLDAMQEHLQSWAFNIREMDLIKQVDIESAPISKNDVDLDTVPEVVNSMIEKGNPDVILVTKTRKSFFERLFKSSVSKAIALELRKPTFFDRIDED